MSYQIVLQTGYINPSWEYMRSYWPHTLTDTWYCGILSSLPVSGGDTVSYGRFNLHCPDHQWVISFQTWKDLSDHLVNTYILKMKKKRLRTFFSSLLLLLFFPKNVFLSHCFVMLNSVSNQIETIHICHEGGKCIDREKNERFFLRASIPPLLQYFFISTSHPKKMAVYWTDYVWRRAWVRESIQAFAWMMKWALRCNEQNTRF